MSASALPFGIRDPRRRRPRASRKSSRPPALAFLADLHRRFDARRLELLGPRAERQKRFDAGETPDFLAETRAIREGDWKVAPIPADLLDRRVEITGPVDRKMIVNALNSGAKVFMADFEDASSPAFANMIEGQANLKDRWAGRIDFTDAATGKRYAVKPSPALLMVRPRGWHLDERHVLRRRRGDVRLAVRLRPLCLPLRQDADRAGRDARVLSAEAREPSRGAAVERGLLARGERARRSRTGHSRRRC